MRYFIGFLVTIGLIVLVLFLIFSGGSSTPPAKQFAVTDYVNSDARAQLIIDGPIVSDQDHEQVEIDVTRTQVAMTIYSGYERTIISTKSYPNNNNAFSAFLYGLQRSNYTKGNINKALADERGYCVGGNRYIYSLNDNSGKQLLRFWSTSCGQGTYKGNINNTQYLFKHQIPDFDTLTENLSFPL